MTATGFQPEATQFLNKYSTRYTALVSIKEFLNIQATLERRFTLKRVRDIIKTYSQTNANNKNVK